MHYAIQLTISSLVVSAIIGCGDTQTTNNTTSSTGTGGRIESSSSGGFGNMGGMGTGGNGAMGGAAGMGGGGNGGGCVATYDDCTTPADENCDGSVLACSGDGLWAKVFGDAEWGDTALVATDVQGNVFVATNLLGQSIDFGGGPLMAQNHDVTLALLSPDGSHMWSKRYGDGSEQVLRAMRSDGAGGVVLAGYFGGTLDFGGSPLVTPPFNKYPFVARIDGTGKHVFSRGFSGSTSYEAHAVAAAADGSVVVGGCGQDTLDLGITPPPQGTWSAFLARLSPTGQTIWAKTFPSSGTYVCVESLAIDPANHVVATGLFEGTVDLGGSITSAGGYDAFVMKLDAMGNVAFRRTAGGMAAQSGTGIGVDPSGDIVITGTYQSSIDWGVGPHMTNAGSSTFVTKFDTAGNVKWSRAFGGGGEVVPGASMVDAAGHTLLTGGFFGAVDFGNGTVTSNGYNDLFVAKLDGMGNLIWKKTMGDGEVQEGGGIAVDQAGYVFLGGRIWSAVDVGTGAVMSHGKDDALVAKLKP